MYNSNFNSGGNQTYTNYNIKVNSIVASSYIWMAVALAITGAISYLVSHNIMLIKLLIANPIVPIVLIVAQIALVIAISGFIDKMSGATATSLLFVYSMLMGVSLSGIFLVYTATSIFTTFLSTAGLFAFMSALGFVTKKDLTSFGNVLVSLLFGMIFASLINFFLRSSIMEYIISIVGVVVFLGLTMFDAQKVKQIALDNLQADEESKTKIIVLCALTLYLDFINLFMYLLRFFGNSRD